jgi:hypothetical protein
MFNIREFLGLGYYTSDLDQFLKEFDKNNAKLSASQRQEINKYHRIYQLRDKPEQTQPKETLWDQF